MYPTLSSSPHLRQQLWLEANLAMAIHRSMTLNLVIKSPDNITKIDISENSGSYAAYLKRVKTLTFSTMESTQNTKIWMQDNRRADEGSQLKILKLRPGLSILNTQFYKYKNKNAIKFEKIVTILSFNTLQKVRKASLKWKASTKYLLFLCAKWMTHILYFWMLQYRGIKRGDHFRPN